jgi:hypothetical protein
MSTDGDLYQKFVNKKAKEGNNSFIAVSKGGWPHLMVVVHKFPSSNRNGYEPKQISFKRKEWGSAENAILMAEACDRIYNSPGKGNEIVSVLERLKKTIDNEINSLK